MRQPFAAGLILTVLALGSGCASDDTSCANNGDCGAGLLCISNRCQSAPPARDCGAGRLACAQDGDCPSRSCSGGCCALTCASRLDCGPGEACRSGVCAPETGSCETDAECASTPATRVCKRSVKLCVECLADADCGQPGVRVCQFERCAFAPGRCSTGIDCKDPAKPRCDGDRRCVQCLQDSDCGGGKRCAAGECQAAPQNCTSDEGCRATPATPRCLVTSGRCVACLAHGDCSADGSRVCNLATNACRQSGCGADAECDAAAPRCRTSDRTCVQCLGDADCGAGRTCNANVCSAPGQDLPCQPDGTCAGTLLCVGDDAAGVCRAPCSLYAAASTCPADRRCMLAGFDASGGPRGACVPAVAGAAGPGATCNSGISCDAHLACIQDSADAGRCRRYCDPAAPGGACTAPEVCQPLVALDAAEVPRTVGVCFPDTKFLDPCAADASCDTGQVCTAGADRSEPTRLVNSCDWPIGSKAALEPCEAGTECRSGVCLVPAPKATTGKGTCHQACTRDAECTGRDGLTAACTDWAFGWHDESGADKIDLIPGCSLACRNELDCKAADACVVVPNHADTAWSSRCRPANAAASGKWGGAPCSRGDECWSGICYTFGSATDGFCAGVCDNNIDCYGGTLSSPTSRCPVNGVAQWVGAGPDGIESTADDVVAPAPLCWGRSCTRDADCAGLSKDPAKPRACAADPDPLDGASILTSCRPRLGSKGGGDFCQQNAECASGWCLEWEWSTTPPRSEKRCFGACSTRSDCTWATTKVDCQDRTWGSRTVKMCVPLQ